MLLTGEVEQALLLPLEVKITEVMKETFKFPKGYEVPIYRIDDILKSLDTDLDSYIIEAIVKQCEFDASEFIRQGIWAGIPYLGNIRVPKHHLKWLEIKGSEILSDAKEKLDEDKYVEFRKALNGVIAHDVKAQRLFNYIVSGFVIRHRKTYNRLIAKGAVLNYKNPHIYAKIICYTLTELTAVPTDNNE